jgi:hypothetical protein
MDINCRYFSYLLRIWLAGDGSRSQWRASLEDTRSGERKGFSSLEALFDYLRRQSGCDAGPKEDMHIDSD